MFGFLRKLFGNKHERDITEIRPIVDQVNEEYKKLSSLSHDQLRNKTLEFRQIIKDYLKDIDKDLEDLKKEAAQTEDISQKQNIFSEVDKLQKNRDQLIEEILEKIVKKIVKIIF